MNPLVVMVSPRDPFGFAVLGDQALVGPALGLLDTEHAAGTTGIHLVAPLARHAQRDALAERLRDRGLEVTAHDTIEEVLRHPGADRWNAAVDAGEAGDLADWLVLARTGRWDGTLWVVEPPDRPGAAATVTDRTPPDRPKPGMVREPAVAFYETAPPARRTPDARQCGILGEHPALLDAVEAAQAVGAHPVPVLLHGETGTGKELFARYTHACSERREEPFVAVNCSALPENLVESTLFGHKRGAFTGADRDRPGKFREAHGGTLFLDEVAELPMAHQPKLLRVLQEGVAEPVGGNPSPVDVRIVAATHRDLAERVRNGEFREDLYYRLSFAVVRIPPLRERRSDIPLIAAGIVREWNRSLRQPKLLSTAAMAVIEQADWPGNVRELQGVIGRSFMLCAAECLEPEDLKFESVGARDSGLPELPALHDGFSLEDYLAQLRGAIINKAMRQTGQQVAAAQLLGVSQQAISKFLSQQDKG